MKMTSIEKRFVNRKTKAGRNIKKLEQAFEHINLANIKTVLELGCGVGFVSHYLAEKYKWTIIGTDYDAEQIQLANRFQPKLEPLSFRVEDAANLTFTDASMDMVVSQNVFHHIPNWQDAIKEIARVLRPGGYLIWLDMTFARIVKNVFSPFVKNYGLYTIDDIETAFQRNRFRILFHEQVRHGVFGQQHFALESA